MVETSIWGVAVGECDASKEAWGWFVYPFVMVYSFYILAQICDGHLTRALEFIVERINLSEDVAGATFLAMASSAPELFTSLISTFVVVSTSGVGNIVGSAVFNLLVIIGVVPIFAGSKLKIWWYPTARDAIFYSASILELGLVLMDGKVYWWEGLIMLLTYTGYVAFFTQNQRVINLLGIEEPPKADAEGGAENASGAQRADEAGGFGPLFTQQAGAGQAPAVETQDSVEFVDAGAKQGAAGDPGGRDSGSRSGSKGSGSRHGSKSFTLRGHKPDAQLAKIVPAPPSEAEDAGAGSPPHVAGQGCATIANAGEAEEEEARGWCRYEPIMLIIDTTMPNRPERLYSLFILCCLWIGLFTYFAVDAGGRMGQCLLGIPDVVMGLIVFAAGTSVPDAMGSIAVAKDGMGDMAVANAVGSNTFDILLGLGLPWFLKGAITGEPIIIPTQLLTEAILILASCLFLYLCILTANKWILTRLMGFLLLALYTTVIAFILIWYEVQYSGQL
mmetsp:Transcript_87419/g.244673  ORF Transcript_87419/g.244673 Transcript_87419/m.244673 type:complete len:504 (+) Transcript_87419:72-1583(+)